MVANQGSTQVIYPLADKEGQPATGKGLDSGLDSLLTTTKGVRRANPSRGGQECAGVCDFLQNFLDYFCLWGRGHISAVGAYNWRSVPQVISYCGASSLESGLK
ncbi:hypothetical protein TNIN_112511 [Trichonephila inaurata madagascariensis]|uniref:Uncharacterized protein n=1 Tax=Trichonephila inaurata madagascariensis TaxID=2747483 RepID=A0A8X6Y523_9ARAC|nr:hypothetical protein TNIN_112511 [Trichonephila inaurata madagascariensis]